MALHLTPEMIEAAYELLRTTLPFKRWKLPDGDDVEFRVIRDGSVSAKVALAIDGSAHVLSVSSKMVGRLPFLVQVVAHEMIHIHEHQQGARLDVSHGASFKRLARQVCRHHGFDEKLF